MKQNQNRMVVYSRFTRVFIITIRHLRNEKQSYILEDIYMYLLLFTSSENTSINIQFFSLLVNASSFNQEIFIQVAYTTILHNLYQYELAIG